MASTNTSKRSYRRKGKGNKANHGRHSGTDQLIAENPPAATSTSSIVAACANMQLSEEKSVLSVASKLPTASNLHVSSASGKENRDHGDGKVSANACAQRKAPSEAVSDEFSSEVKVSHKVELTATQPQPVTAEGHSVKVIPKRSSSPSHSTCSSDDGWNGMPMAGGFYYKGYLIDENGDYDYVDDMLLDDDYW